MGDISAKTCAYELGVGIYAIYMVPACYRVVPLQLSLTSRRATNYCNLILCVGICLIYVNMCQIVVIECDEANSMIRLITNFIR